MHMTWRDQDRINRGHKYRFAILALTIIFYLFMAWALVESLKFDPLLPVIIIFAMVILIPTTVFLMEIVFFSD